MDNKVLYIAYYFPPMGLSGVQRTLKFVKYLPEYGWMPLVLTTGSGSYYGFDKSLLDELDNRHKIFRTESSGQSKKKKFPSTNVQKLGRLVTGFFFLPDTKRGWIKKAIPKAEKIINEEKPKVIVSTAPPYSSHLIAYKLSRKYNIPYVLDYRDTWVGNPYISMPTKFHRHYHQSMERDILKTASKIVVISRSAKENLLKLYKFLEHTDIEIIPHGYDTADMLLTGDYKNYNRFVITHAGMFQDDRNPEPFLKAFKKLIEEDSNKSKIELRLIGLMRKNHKKLIKKYGLEENVLLTGNLSHSDTIRHIKSSDALWLLQNDSIRTPGKLFEYFGTGKPILATVPKGNMRDLALSSGVALACDPEDETEIFKNLKKYYILWQKEMLPVGNDEFIKQFDRKNLTEKLSYLLSYASNI